MRFSNRAAFGWIETPAPISRITSACSNTVTSRPRARSASAAVRPPIPPPTIAMRSELGISFRPFLWAAVTVCGYPRQILAPMRHKGMGYPGDPIAGARSDANRMLRQDERESRMRHADKVASFLDALIDSFEHRNQSRGSSFWPRYYTI